MLKIISIVVLLTALSINAQESKNVLFLGNSYTYVNDMPQLLVDVATSVGDVVVKDQNTPGGYTLEGHSINNISLDKIRQGAWDYVILQEQSQRPSLQESYVEEFVYPYAKRLNDTIVKYNACAETSFYMTWGRENGDASNCGIWPPVCTYEGMDDLLKERYLFMASENNAIVSPVGAVWRYMRDNNLGIDLYSGDGSHPSLAGSYTAAIAFYTVLFKKDPTLITFNSTLASDDATIIKAAVKLIVFDNLSEWFVDSYTPIADFSYTNNGNLEYSFMNNSTNSANFLWDFGDDSFSNNENPNHTYSEEGEYEVTLTSNYLCENLSIKTETISVILSLNDYSKNNLIKAYPNPVNDILVLDLMSTKYDEFELEIFNIHGSKINFSIISKNDFNYSINLKHLNVGLYFLKIFTKENKSQIIKLIKK